MNYKKYIRIFLKGTVLSMAVFFLSVSFAKADEPQLEVVFAPDPLFENINFLPGDDSSGTITVTNNSGKSQQIITESINGTDPDGLGSVLDLRIFKEGDPDLWTGTLGDFLSSAGEVGLSTLSDGAIAVYTYEVTFGADVEEYQNATLGFDICVGFEDENGRACGNTVIGEEIDPNPNDPNPSGGEIPGSGGGGGGPLSPHNLIVKNEKITGSDIPSGKVVIVWDTNLLATSQVIYGLESGGLYTLELTDGDDNLVSNYDDQSGFTYLGYPMWTAEDPIKVTSHSVELTGLESGKTYKFRVVSRASPPTIGLEYVFEFKEPEIIEITNPETGVIVQTEVPPRIILASGIEEEGREPVGKNLSEEEVVAIEDEINDSLVNNNLASILFAFPDFSSECLLYLLLVIIIIFIVQKIWNKFVRDNDEDFERKNMLFWIIGVAIAVLATALFGYWCVTKLLTAVLVILIIVTLIFYRGKKLI